MKYYKVTDKRTGVDFLVEAKGPAHAVAVAAFNQYAVVSEIKGAELLAANASDVLREPVPASIDELREPVPLSIEG